MTTSESGGAAGPLTALEFQVIDRLVDTHLGAGDQLSFFDAGVLEGGTWADCLVDEMGDPKVFRGVLSSLIRKDVFYVATVDGTDKWVQLSDLGREVVSERAADVLADRKIDELRKVADASLDQLMDSARVRAESIMPLVAFLVRTVCPDAMSIDVDGETGCLESVFSATGAVLAVRGMDVWDELDDTDLLSGYVAMLAECDVISGQVDWSFPSV